MILFELVGKEDHQAYQDLSIDNLERQYDFVRSLVNAHVAVKRPMISEEIILALNAHAIACLHVYAGQYRPCSVEVGNFQPPAHYRVPALMNALIDEVNRYWQETDSIALAAYVLWKLNVIHPFINGNGRTARALCYFVVCVKAGGLLKGKTTLPELIRTNRNEYVNLLKETDKAFAESRPDFMNGLHTFLTRLLDQQLKSAQDGQ